MLSLLGKIADLIQTIYSPEVMNALETEGCADRYNNLMYGSGGPSHGLGPRASNAAMRGRDKNPIQLQRHGHVMEIPAVGFGMGCPQISEGRAEGEWPGLRSTEIDLKVESLVKEAIRLGYRLRLGFTR